MSVGRRRRGEEGAAAVEAALVTGVIVLLIFGIMELTFLVRDYVAVTSAARVGARIASTGADDGPCITEPDDLVPCPSGSVPELAQHAADAISESIDSLPEDSVTHVMVYKANDKGFPGAFTSMPSVTQCVTQCVVYTWSPAKNRFRYSRGSWVSSQIQACVPSRKSASGAAGILDTVGVQVVVRHKLLTGMFGSALTLSDHSVMKFEPLNNDYCEAGYHQ